MKKLVIVHDPGRLFIRAGEPMLALMGTKGVANSDGADFVIMSAKPANPADIKILFIRWPKDMSSFQHSYGGAISLNQRFGNCFFFREKTQKIIDMLENIFGQTALKVRVINSRISV